MASRETTKKKSKKKRSVNAKKTTEPCDDLPYGGDINTAMKAQDREAIRLIMDRRRMGSPEKKAKAASATNEIDMCPICNEERSDIEMLTHASTNGGDISSHRACASCRENMIISNSSCPWCRSEMVWKNLYGFLDGFKGHIGGRHERDHQGLANLLTYWQEFEVSRSRSDLHAFARDLCTDSSLAQHVQRGISNRSGWLRDSIGLWMRLHGMHQDGEVDLPAEDAARLQATVDIAFDIFQHDHGGHEDFVAAFYQQSCAAWLSASFSGSSISTLTQLVQRAGNACVEVFDAHYTTKPNAENEFRQRVSQDYVVGVQDAVWGGAPSDPVWTRFFAHPPPSYSDADY